MSTWQFLVSLKNSPVELQKADSVRLTRILRAWALRTEACRKAAVKKEAALCLACRHSQLRHLQRWRSATAYCRLALRSCLKAASHAYFTTLARVFRQWKASAKTAELNRIRAEGNFLHTSYQHTREGPLPPFRPSLSGKTLYCRRPEHLSIIM